MAQGLAGMAGGGGGTSVHARSPGRRILVVAGLAAAGLAAILIYYWETEVKPRRRAARERIAHMWDPAPGQAAPAAAGGGHMTVTVETPAGRRVYHQEMPAAPAFPAQAAPVAPAAASGPVPAPAPVAAAAAGSGPGEAELRARLRSADWAVAQQAMFALHNRGLTVDYDRERPMSAPRRPADSSELISFEGELRGDSLWVGWTFHFGEELFGSDVQPAWFEIEVTGGTLAQRVSKRFDATPGDNTASAVLATGLGPGDYAVTAFLWSQNRVTRAQLNNNAGMLALEKR